MNKEMQVDHHSFGTKVASVFLSAAMLATSFLGMGSVLTAPSVTADAASDYGLADNIQDGNILHCFNWKISDITAALPDIAAAGFTSVQTSPVQPHDASGTWYWLYQPLGFSIGNDICSESDLRTLCSEADKYGIKVIVDVVANHLAGGDSGDWKPTIQSDLNNSQYFHNTNYSTGRKNVDWGNRWQVTHCNIGMPDLNSEHSYVQSVVAGLVSKLKACGVDGIRWDAAKHIGLPSEDCQFWPAVTTAGLYNYGEILDSPGGDGASIMKEYTKYIGITDSSYSGEITGAIRDGKISTNSGNWVNQGVSSSRIVYWPESHDTYCNNGWTRDLSQDVMDRAYAVLGARANSQTLYLSRPFEKEHTRINYGVKGSTHYTEKQVAAVNHFHNAMAGTKEYYTTGSNCFVVCREGGAVIVAASGSNFSVTVPNGGGIVKQGTYTDEISGSTWTVTGSNISGKIGSTGIAVIYDQAASGASVSATPGSSSFTDSVTATLSVKNAASGNYTTSDGKSGTFTNGQTITFGSGVAVGGTVTLTLSAKGDDGETKTASYTYTKKDPSAVTTIYFDNSSYKWSNVYAYIYDDGTSGGNNGGNNGGNTSSSNILFSDTLGWGKVYAYFFNASGTVGSEWPGAQMSSNGTNEYGQGQYKVSVPSGATSVVFNNGSGTQTGDVALTGATGYYCDGSPSNVKSWVSTGSSAGSTATENAAWPGAKMTLDSASGYYKLEVPSNLVNGKVIFNDGTGSASNRYPANMEPGLAINDTSMLFSSGNSWSAYTPVKPDPVPDPEVPTVKADKASGSSFTTETMTVKLTLANATKGTYKVDGGPEKTFTSSASVVIGEGKIGDSTVTVETTATDGSTTKSYTFTYNKKYVMKTTSTSAASANSNYATNPGGHVGANKTIKSVSDFTEDTLVAQGVANDDPGAFRGLHEAPKFDLYALYAAWDSTNLYVGIQYTNVIDVVAPEQEAPQTGRGKPNGADADIPQMILFDLKTGNYTDGSTNSAAQSTVWNTNITFGGSTKVDKVIMYSPKKGIDNWSVFPVTGGKIDYDNAISPGYQKALEGASIAWEDGFFCKTMNGIKSNGYLGYKPSDLESSSGEWVDFLTTSHDKSQDTFCIITIPLKYLGVSASDIASKGIGLMAVTTYGESGMGCLPHDTVMLDNATEPYEKDESTSGEKSDADKITVPLASVGKSGGTVIPDPVPDDDTPLQVNFGTDRSAPQLTTTALTLKAIGYGGTAPYKYQFSVDGNVVKASNTTATYSWKPSTSGKHTLKCVITDSKGATATVSKTFTAEGSSISTGLTNTSTISETSVPKCTWVSLTGGATGGSGSYKYAFYYKKSTSAAWTSVGEIYGNQTEVMFGPASTGKYLVKINVKDTAGTVVTKQFTLTSTAPTSSDLQNKSTVGSTTIVKGTPIKVTGKATGGSGSYKYAFYYKKTTSKAFTAIGTEYGSATSTTFTPASSADYNVRINVKDGTGRIVTMQYKLTVGGSTSTLTNNSTVSATNVTAGTAITLKGAASGGSGSYKYAFYYKKTTSSSYTTIGTAYGTATTATFKPGSAANYDVKISVKDGAGTVVSKSFVIKATAASTSTTLTNNSKLSSVNVTKGTKVTITGAASGGTSPYTYSYYYKKSTGTSYNTISADTSSTTASFTPSVAATYDVKVVVKDKTGATATKTFSVISK